jgi:hypothetical protein
VALTLIQHISRLRFSLEAAVALLPATKDVGRAPPGRLKGRANEDGVAQRHATSCGSTVGRSPELQETPAVPLDHPWTFG